MDLEGTHRIDQCTQGRGGSREHCHESLLARRLDFERAISSISSKFIGAYDLERAIAESLAEMGQLRKATRAYMFLPNEEKTMLRRASEWHVEGLQEESLREFAVNLFPSWIERLGKGDYVHIKSSSRMPSEAGEERKVLESHGIKSVLMYPLLAGGSFSGFIGFESSERSLEWIEEDVALLRVASEVISRAIEQKKQEQELERHREHLEQLVEERTQELKALNEELTREMERRKKAQEERERYIGELTEALSSIKTLKGLLPICAGCKKIRNDRGYWQQLETYMAEHLDATFSHSYCPDCVKTLYPDIEF